MSTAPTPPEQSTVLGNEDFRTVFGHFASGVTVITTQLEGQPFGTTASAVSSLSLDPPRMLVCLNRSSSTHDALVRAKRYAINILAAEQADVAARFGRKGADKFIGTPYRMSSNGLPLIDGALATIECEISDTATGGTHTIFIGKALQASARAGDPLAYYRGRMDRLERTVEAETDVAVRNWILRRAVPAGEAIEVSLLAATLDAEPSFVYNALVRLGAQGLVTRDRTGAFTPTAITADFVDNLYAARQAIEIGVIEGYLEHAPDDALEQITERGVALAESPTDTSAELDAFLEANLDFHCAIIGLAGSRQLAVQFRQLSIAPLWRDTYTSEMWKKQMGHPLIQRLTEALSARDAAESRSIIQSQAEFIRNAARAVIEQRGGAM